METIIKIGVDVNIIERLKSPVVIIELIAILATLAVFLLPGYSEFIKQIALAVTAVISVVAGLNNPTDKNAF